MVIHPAKEPAKDQTKAAGDTNTKKPTTKDTAKAANKGKKVKVADAAARK
jgi:hypothetical protein